MKRLLNTLYVTTQGAYLNREGETVQVSVEREVKLRVPIHTLGNIVCFGQVSCSPPLLGMCAERDVGVSFLTEHGRFWARMQGPVSGNVLLRRTQYRWADDDSFSADIARTIVTAKVANGRTVLLRALRDGAAGGGMDGNEEGEGEREGEEDRLRLRLRARARTGEGDGGRTRADELRRAVRSMAGTLRELGKPASLEVVRGIEGDAARAYFDVFDHLIVAQKEDFFFRARSRRPPLDNVNALLSFLYTLLAHDVRSALETVGLDPAVGFLHRDRPGRPGLALDMMEELRPYVADRLALSLINRQQVKGKGFTRTESGAVVMDDDTRKEVLMGYQKRKQEEIQHPFLNEKVAVGLLPHVQALLMSRYIRGDLDGYPAFISK